MPLLRFPVAKDLVVGNSDIAVLGIRARFRGLVARMLSDARTGENLDGSRQKKRENSWGLLKLGEREPAPKRRRLVHLEAF